jgi:periplasmic copper chaperone A
VASRAKTIGALAGSALVIAAGAAFLLLPGGGRAASAQTPTPQTASNGAGITVAGAYVREPASPDVAAGYFTVRNDGDATVTLTDVTSDASSDTSMHAESGNTMAPLTAPKIPAHGTLQFTAGGNHVMMMNPKALKTGDHVVFTLYFAQGPAVTVDAPVIAITAPVPAS